MVEGAPRGRPAFFCGVSGGAGLRPSPLLGVPGVSRGCRHRGFLLHRVVGHRYIYYTT